MSQEVFPDKFGDFPTQGTGSSEDSFFQSVSEKTRGTLCLFFFSLSLSLSALTSLRGEHELLSSVRVCALWRWVPPLNSIPKLAVFWEKAWGNQQSLALVPRRRVGGDSRRNTFLSFFNQDASPCACPFEVTVLDCLRGLAKARQFKFFDFDTFDLAESEPASFFLCFFW